MRKPPSPPPRQEKQCMREEGCGCDKTRDQLVVICEFQNRSCVFIKQNFSKRRLRGPRDWCHHRIAVRKFRGRCRCSQVKARWLNPGQGPPESTGLI